MVVPGVNLLKGNLPDFEHVVCTQLPQISTVNTRSYTATPRKLQGQRITGGKKEGLGSGMGKARMVPWQYGSSSSTTVPHEN